ncbi:MAG: PD40 domain-containing protein [Bacteroides sp.]|nr:PD40 domain-containing protein [Bacteroides sp.]
MKKTIYLAVFAMVGLSSCGGTKFAITSGDESLSALTKVTDAEGPCISPFGGDNGRDLYFAAQEKGKYYNIYKKENPFSSAMSQKTSGKNQNYAPAYCAAIDRIAFRCQNEGSSTSDIYMMANSGGKALRQVTESTDSYENNPSFSKDGKYLVYDKQSYSYAKMINFGTLLGLGASTLIVENSEIWLKNLETGETMLLGNGYQPCISPDGKTIAYVKYASDAKSCSIWTMSLEGDNQVQVTDAKKGYAFYPRWSPDGKRIVFQSTKKDKKDADLYIVDIDGNNLTQVTLNKSHDGTPYWTTDGYLYFVSDRGNKKGNYQIWRFKVTD